MNLIKILNRVKLNSRQNKIRFNRKQNGIQWNIIGFNSEYKIGFNREYNRIQQGFNRIGFIELN